MAKTDRRKNIDRWATKKLDKILGDLHEESEDGVAHLWNAGQRLATAAEEDPDILNLILVDWAHKVTREDDHRRRPDFKRAKNGQRSFDGFDYDRARLMEIPLVVERRKANDSEKIVLEETPKRKRFCECGPEENRGYLKILRNNKNAVIRKYEIDERRLNMFIRAQKAHPEWKTNDDVMHGRFGWEPAPEQPPEPEPETPLESE
jgi:hypothetical protein